MDISCFMTYAEKMEGEMLRERRMRESKRAQFEGEFSNSMIVGGNGRFQQG